MGQATRLACASKIGVALALFGCGSDAPLAAPSFPLAAAQVTFGGVQALGPHQQHAVIRRTAGGGAGPPRVTEESLDLQWRDTDHWAYTLTRNGRVGTEVVVWAAVAWTDRSGGSLSAKGDAEPYRVQLARTWDPWAFALDSLAEQLVITPMAVDLVEGRRAHRHAVQAQPAPARPHRGWTVTAAQGAVWYDEATATRLKGNVQVSATSGARTLEVTLTFTLDGIGVVPAISAPDGDNR